MATVSTPATEVPTHRRGGARGADCGSQRDTESRAATWAGTNTGTCAMTRSASRESGAKWGSASSASTTIARVVEPRAAIVAFGDMRTKRGDAESGLAVDQKVDLVGEQVSVIHGSSGPLYGRWVWGFQRWIRLDGVRAGLWRVILAYAPAPGEARAGRGGCRSSRCRGGGRGWLAISS